MSDEYVTLLNAPLKTKDYQKIMDPSQAVPQSLTFLSSFTTKDIIIVALLMCLIGVIVYLVLQSVRQDKKIESVRALYYTQQLNVNEYLKEFMSSPNNVPLVQSWIDPAVRPMVRFYAQQGQAQHSSQHPSQNQRQRDEGPPPLESEIKSYQPLPPHPLSTSSSSPQQRSNPLEQIMGLFGGLLNGVGVSGDVTVTLGNNDNNNNAGGGGGLGAIGGLLSTLLSGLNNQNGGGDGDNADGNDNPDGDNDDREQDDTTPGQPIQLIQ